MEITGKVHCFFEQSGTFKNEFIKLGIPAEDYDIQNNFGQTDHITDLFGEINRAYNNLTRQDKTRQDKTRQDKTLFDSIDPCQDLIVAFFPCIYFECLSMMAFNWGYTNYRNMNTEEKTIKIIERENNRHEFYILLLKFIAVIEHYKIRMVFENPYAMQHYLKQGNFVKAPDIIDNNRMERGDYFIKPTAYWFFNCEPTHGFTYQNNKKQKAVIGSAKEGVKSAKGSSQAGLCSEERSMISPDYARNWICDFILGKYQEDISGPTLFDMNEYIK